MPPLHAWFPRSRRTFALGTCMLVVPAVLVFSGLGFLRAHGAGASGRGVTESTSLVGAVGVADVCDGRSLCFEFETASEGPLWVLVQNRGDKASRNVLVSRTPGFEDSHALRPGSSGERYLLAALHELEAHGDEDLRVINNLERLCDLISNRQRPCPANAEWYLY